MSFRKIFVPIALCAAPLAAQDNPFALTGGNVRSAYVVYDLTSKGKPVPGATSELGVAADRWIMSMVLPYEAGGKKDVLRSLVITTRDSQYSYNTLGAGAVSGEVSPTLRPHLARAYAGLDAAAKQRFRQNVKLAVQASGSSDDDRFITLIGEKTGSETIAGHRCDVYKTKQSVACVLPQSPTVMLRWKNDKDGTDMVARKVTLNGPIPPALGVLPKGVSWKKNPYDDADFIMNIWMLKKQTDPVAVPAGTLTQFAVGYLSSPQAGTELREMGGGESQDASESGEAGDSSESSSD
jgi:hypothetical protein